MRCVCVRNGGAGKGEREGKMGGAGVVGGESGSERASGEGAPRAGGCAAPTLKRQTPRARAAGWGSRGRLQDVVDQVDMVAGLGHVGVG